MSNTNRKQGDASNVRVALLKASRTLLERDGHCWFVRTAAKLAGVTSGAPYKHFANRLAIEIELARIGLEELALLERISPESRREVWLEWARRNPQLFSLMFMPGMRSAVDSSADVDERVLGEVVRNLWQTGVCK